MAHFKLKYLFLLIACSLIFQPGFSSDEQSGHRMNPADAGPAHQMVSEHGKLNRLTRFKVFLEKLDQIRANITTVKRQLNPPAGQTSPIAQQDAPASSPPASASSPQTFPVPHVPIPERYSGDPGSEMTAKPGQDITLPCQGPVNQAIAVLEWTRADLKAPQHVFLCADGHVDTIYQNPSFKNRVELRDGEMKNGDLSLLLKNVTKNDSGTYECRFKADKARHRLRAIIESDPISTIRLKVKDSGPMDQEDNKDHATEGPVGHGHVAVLVVVPVLLLLLLLVIFVIWRKRRAHRQRRVHS